MKMKKSMINKSNTFYGFTLSLWVLFEFIFIDLAIKFNTFYGFSLFPIGAIWIELYRYPMSNDNESFLSESSEWLKQLVQLNKFKSKIKRVKWMEDKKRAGKVEV
jgi:hypothetical protein